MFLFKQVKFVKPFLLDIYLYKIFHCNNLILNEFNRLFDEQAANRSQLVDMVSKLTKRETYLVKKLNL